MRSFRPPIVELVDDAENRNLVKQVEQAINVGVWQVVSGSAVPALLRIADAAAEKLFSHPVEVLQRYEIPGIQRNRGYSPPGGERAGREDSKINAPPDHYRDFWMSGCSWERGAEATAWNAKYDAYDAKPVGLSPNFGNAVDALLRAMLRDFRIILRCVEQIRGLPQDSLVDMTMGADTVIRSLNYRTDLPEGTMLANAHTDINACTQLASLNLIGVQGYRAADGQRMLDNAEEEGGEWVDFDLVQGASLYTLSDMITMIPGCEGLNSVIHRVLVRPGISSHRRRVFAGFLHILREVELTDGRLSGDWFQERLDAITVHLASKR